MSFLDELIAVFFAKEQPVVADVVVHGSRLILVTLQANSLLCGAVDE